MTLVLGWACSHPSELFKLSESKTINPTSTSSGVSMSGDRESLGNLWGGTGDGGMKSGALPQRAKTETTGTWLLLREREREEVLAEKRALK